MPKFFFNSWFSLAVFVVLVIFVPYRVSFLSLKPSDFWLFAVLFYQYNSGNNFSIQFKGRKLLVRFGIILGITAVLGTFLQAFSDGTPINAAFISHFYRFFRFFLIFKFVENIVLSNSFTVSEKFLKTYTWIGGVVFLMSFIEYFYIQPYSSIILGLYYVAPEETLTSYLHEIGRLSGVMGNPNATAITILSFLIFPSILLIQKQSSFMVKLISISFVFTGIYILLIMTASRTAILLSLLLITILLSLSFTKISFFTRLALISISSLVILYFVVDAFQISFELSDRVLNLAQGRNTLGEKAGVIEIMGREFLWKDRIDNFQENGHFLSVITGMGYTKIYKDYADNGLFSSFLNLGLVGLSLRIMIYILVVKLVFKYGIRIFRQDEQQVSIVAFSMIAFFFLAWEITAETVEHIKVGQLFFLFVSLGAVSVARYLNSNRNKNEYTN